MTMEEWKTKLDVFLRFNDAKACLLREMNEVVFCELPEF